MKVIVEVTENFANGIQIFGIRIQTTEKEYNYNGITEIKSEAEELCAQIKDGEPDPVHFDDIVRDFIMGKACDRLIINSL